MSIDTAIPETVLGSAARTASASAPASSVPVSARLRAQLNVTAASGVTPTLDVVIEDTVDGTNWNIVGTFAQKTAVGREVINITTPFVANNLRIRWTIAGTTPSFTFAVAWVPL